MAACGLAVFVAAGVLAPTIRDRLEENQLIAQLESADIEERISAAKELLERRCFRAVGAIFDCLVAERPNGPKNPSPEEFSLVLVTEADSYQLEREISAALIQARRRGADLSSAGFEGR